MGEIDGAEEGFECEDPLGEDWEGPYFKDLGGEVIDLNECVWFGEGILYEPEEGLGGEDLVIFLLLLDFFAEGVVRTKLHYDGEEDFEGSWVTEEAVEISVDLRKSGKGGLRLAFGAAGPW